MTTKKQLVSLLLIVLVITGVITAGIFYNKYQIEKDRDCPAYKLIKTECRICPKQKELIVPQYSCPAEEILRIGKYSELIETQTKVIDAQQDSIYKLRNYIGDECQ